MGWNSWNKFACNVSEDMIKSMADAMIKSGMKDAGYVYVNIDDCWQVSRDANANIVADPQRFPHGMKAVGDYIHSLGLKFGVYSDAGSKTCAGRPGGLGHEYQDALQYAAWGVDYLKYDWCNATTQDAKASYANIRAALDASGRPIVLSICEWGTAKPWLWGKEVGGNLWRSTGDIEDRWGGQQKWPDGTCCSNGVLSILDQQVGLQSYAGPGHWNDPDMLEVGNGGMTDVEYRSHFSLWALLAAPLIAGNDLRTMRPEIHDILTNKEVIAVNQDALGREGERVSKSGDLEVWAKQLEGRQPRRDPAEPWGDRTADLRPIACRWNILQPLDTYFLAPEDQKRATLTFGASEPPDEERHDGPARCVAAAAAGDPDFHVGAGGDPKPRRVHLTRARTHKSRCNAIPVGLCR